MTELLGPIREPQPKMPELSKEELEELLAPTARHEITDEGPMPEPDDEDEYVSSVMSEITDDDDPEIKALAKEIAELERQEQAEKFKKKSKKVGDESKRKRGMESIRSLFSLFLIDNGEVYEKHGRQM